LRACEANYAVRLIGYDLRAAHPRALLRATSSDEFSPLMRNVDIALKRLTAQLPDDDACKRMAWVQ
jgi:hypothetical protein